MRSELDPTPAPEGNATGTLEPSHPADAVALPRPEMPRGTAALDVVCPYLRSPDGTWRSARPQRDHRCWAQSPPVPLSTLTQAQLCLTVTHTSCDLYVAELKRRADELARDRIAPERLSGARFGALVHPVPLAIDVPGEHRLPDTPTGRARLVAVALLGVLAVIVLAGGIYVLGSGPSATPPILGLASPTIAVSITPPTPRSTVAPTPGSTPRVTPRPTVTPTSTPVPSGTPAIARQYKVMQGDTLRTIAQRFGVTKAAILAVNDLGNPPVLTPGDTINIPA
jgi:LysM repeat protein